MDEKCLSSGNFPPLSPHPTAVSSRTSSAMRTTSKMLLAACALTAAVWCWNTHTDIVIADPLSLQRTPAMLDNEEVVHVATTSKDEWKVPLEAHIMSKCPDALDCLELLLVPTMSLTFSHVNLTLSYIGTPSPSDNGVSCKHGPSECLGNIIELCAAHLYPDPKIYLGFTLCLTERYEEIPSRELTENCALEHGMDFGKLNECASRDEGDFGMGLLRESVNRSREVGAGISCTIRLDERVRCVRDGGEWKDCAGGSDVQSLVDDIDTLWKEHNEESKA